MPRRQSLRGRSPPRRSLTSTILETMPEKVTLRMLPRAAVARMKTLLAAPSSITAQRIRCTRANPRWRMAWPTHLTRRSLSAIGRSKDRPSSRQPEEASTTRGGSPRYVVVLGAQVSRHSESWPKESATRRCSERVARSCPSRAVHEVLSIPGSGQPEKSGR